MAEERWALREGYELARFDEQSSFDDADVIALWETEGVLEPEERERRVHEVHLVARGPDGDLAGLSTAYLDWSTQLGMDLWHYRAFVPTAHRRTAVAVYLAVRGREDLSERFVTRKDTRAAGVLYVVEHPGLKLTLDDALWRPALFTYIGAAGDDNHVRVHYFPSALTPDPPR